MSALGHDDIDQLWLLHNARVVNVAIVQSLHQIPGTRVHQFFSRGLDGRESTNVSMLVCRRRVVRKELFGFGNIGHAWFCFRLEGVLLMGVCVLKKRREESKRVRQDSLCEP